MKLKDRSILKAFSHAFDGMHRFFLHERNGRIELIVALVTIVLGFLLRLSITEWTVILFCIAMVISLEIINSAIEKLCDLVNKEYHPVIMIVKDMSAAAVLCSVIISVTIGLMIFLPRILP